MSLLISLLALGFIILIHEFGHFLFAKLMGVGVVEFSLGMGPRLLSFVKGNTRYSLRILPLGGSCMMLGEGGDETDSSGDAKKEYSDKNSADQTVMKSDAETAKNPDSAGRNLRELANGGFSGEEITSDEKNIYIDGRAYSKESQFTGKPAWKRFLIIFGGPLFNFVLAFLLSLVIVGTVGWDRPLILEVTEASAADKAGIKSGDSICFLAVDGDSCSIKTARDIQLFFTANAAAIEDGTAVKARLRTADGNEKTVLMQPVYDENTGRHLCGFAYQYFYEPCESFSELLEMSLHNIVYCFRSTIESLRMMLRGEVKGNDVKGVVGMVAVMDETVEEASESSTADAVLTLFNIMLLLSASLGVMNLLPLPALDGGRLVFILIEMITGKCVPRKLEGIIHAIGTVILLALMMLVMFNDVWNLIK